MFLVNNKKNKKKKNYKIVKESAFFDVAWYLDNNLDVKNAGVDPISHYLDYGWKEGRAPSLGFRTDLFLNSSECPVLLLESMRMKRKDFNEEKFYYKEFKSDSNFPLSAVNTKKFFGYKKNITGRTAIIAGFSEKSIISNSDLYLIKQLSKHVDNILFIMDNPLIEETELQKIESIVTFVYASRHGMYDFGSYKIGVEYFLNTPELYENTSELLILNDSVIGPVFDLSELFKKMSSQKCDFWGLVNTRVKILALNKDIQHIQSWFFAFKKNVFSSEVFKNFFHTVTQKKDFCEVVNSFEIPFTKILCDEGFTYKVLVDWKENVFEDLYKTIGNYNQTLMPLTLLKDYKCPFIKKKLFDKNTENTKTNLEPLEDVLHYLSKENPELYSLIKKEYSIDDLEALPIKERIKYYDVISFDVFDTLLIRPFVSPSDLFDLIEQVEKIPGFAIERVAAEKRARDKLKKQEDITIDDIYQNIIDEFEYVKSIELNYEERFLKPHPNNYKLFLEAIKLGKKVIVTSDMYFTKSFLEHVLDINGYNQLDNVFVSSDYKKCKWSGNLFKEVIKKYPKSKIIHIGDNYDADVKAPLKLDIDAHWVNKYFDTFIDNPLNYKFKSYIEQVKGKAFASWHLALIAYQWCFNKINLKDYFWFLGYTFAAPIAIGYCNFIYKTLKKNGINIAAFVSRDGYLLKKLMEKMYPNLGIKYVYVYASRILNIQNFADYNNEHQYLKVILKQNDIDFNESDTFEELEKIYKKNEKDIKNKTIEFRKEYEKHLETLGIQDKDKIASIDCTTGRFSSQKFLSKFWGDKLRFGIYLSKFREDYHFKNYCYAEKLFTSNDKAVAILNELFITSPEGTIKGIKDGRVIYGKDKEAQTRTEVVQKIQKGVFDYLKVYKEQIGDLDLPISYSKDVFSLTQALTLFMSVVDQDNLNSVKHAGNIENSDYETIFKLIRNSVNAP